MTRLLYDVSMSLDGFIAGINQSRQNPMGTEASNWANGGGSLPLSAKRSLSPVLREALPTPARPSSKKTLRAR